MKNNSNYLKYNHIAFPFNLLIHPAGIRLANIFQGQHFEYMIHFSEKDICLYIPYSLNSNSTSSFIVTTQNSSMHFHMSW